MISNPKIGQRVQIWYRASLASFMPHHGRIGVVMVKAKPHYGIAPKEETVVFAGKAKRRRGPANHGIMIEGVGLVVVPAGNLWPPPTDQSLDVPLGD